MNNPETINNTQKEILNGASELHELDRMRLSLAQQMGKHLAEQKAEFGEEDWQAWVEECLPVDIRSARLYMELYKARSAIRDAFICDITEASRFMENPSAWLRNRSFQMDTLREREERGLGCGAIPSDCPF